MAFMEFKCKACGHVFEEFTRDGKYPACPVCGGETEQKYSGKCWVNSVHKGECSGHCAICKGCGK